MIRWMGRGLCLVGLLVAAKVALSQEFSADVVNLKKNDVAAKKIYAGKDKVRVDLEVRKSYGPNALIIDEVESNPIALLPTQRLYMEGPLPKAAPLITQFWRVSDVDDACPQWKKTAEQASPNSKFGTCTKVGSDEVNGRNTVKYKSVSTDGDTGYVWVDAKLHCVVKMEGSTTGMELRNIQEGAQPASLFEIPAGYSKLDIGR